MPYSPPSEFTQLYKLYTSDPDSMGKHLTVRMSELTEDDPLLVITGSDAVLFPGSGKPPVVESFRKSTRGFIELASISHLGTAVAWLVRLRELKDPSWRRDAERLIEQMDRTRRINTADLWLREIAVPALAGYESKIADMVDYSCAVTKAILVAGLADESLMNFEHIRRSYLEPVGSAAVPIPINDMMVATFALAFLDIGHRMIRWMRDHVSDWERLMVMLSGRSGRPTAGLTWANNNMCHLVWRASEQRLPVERVYIAPHAPSLVLADIENEAQLRKLNTEFREIWNNTRASVELARAMFAGFPAFEPATSPAPTLSSTGSMVFNEMPALRSPDDRFTAITRLRFVMEDPGQLLANSVAPYIIDQLCANGNRPADVVIPGFTNVAYPARGRA
ncbi:MAG: hypothetical protein QOD56_1202 [Gammaproteobacteria bacterium]|jgi:hypothetical protein|nr:hypothetical protein [Gammaproteobacteria bacterium]